MKLLQQQVTLEKDLGHPFVDISLVNTLLKCSILGQSSKASKIRYDFKISDKKFTILEFRGIVDLQNWEAMELV